MSRVCQLTGKRSIVGNHVSHSNRKTKRRFYPNLQEKSFFVPETGMWVRLKVSAQALRTIDKKGIYQFVKEQQAKGFVPGLDLDALGC
jgi:large subunit ribosomal protein L28